MCPVVGCLRCVHQNGFSGIYSHDSCNKQYVTSANGVTKARVFFIFRFTDPPDPIFLKIEKKEKRRLFQFYFCIFLRLMPVQY